MENNKRDDVFSEKKVQLEEKINNSPLFSIEKADSAYATEALRFKNLIGEYIDSFYQRKYEAYGLEIMETINSCLKSYSLEKGPFLAYYMSSLKNRCNHADSVEKINADSGGMHLSNDQRRIIVSIRKLLALKGITDDEINDDVVVTLAKCMGISCEKMKKAIRLYVSHHTTGTEKEIDGEKVSIIDARGETEKSAEAYVLSKVNSHEILAFIEDMYQNKMHASQREVFSPCFTALIANAIRHGSLNVEKYDFVDKDIMRTYLRESRVPLRKEIADKLGKKESSVSRTMADLLDRLRAGLEEAGF